MSCFVRRLRKFGPLCALSGFLSVLVVSLASAEDEQSGKVDDYNQWKQALGGAQTTDPRTMSAPEGYVVELLRSAGPNEGSWISLTFDARGRIIIAREDKGLLRMNLDEVHRRSQEKNEKTSKPASLENVNDTLLECRGLLWAYDALYANANNSKGLFRLRFDETKDRFEQPELLQTTPGNVGHGRNDLTLGPDGAIYLIHGDDVSLPTDFQPETSPLRNYSDERLLPCDWDNQLFNASMKLPGGHVIRTDRDGKKWDLVAGGLRNPYGIDFNPDGEMFTYDADMEWDVGMPWYRPTRVLHLVSGADYGWRRGTGTWKAWYPDSLPAAVDVGLGSPTAVKFGTRSAFPEHDRKALFILDWAYGRILAIDLASSGASYTATVRPFLSGRPLNVTDLEFGPDGAMYFLTGGRKTQSGLYRVKYVGPHPDKTAASANTDKNAAPAQKSRELRRQLEAMHSPSSSVDVTAIWPHLGSDDPWIRNAARVALEREPSEKWWQRSLEEKNPQIGANALLALSRVGTKEQLDPLIQRLLDLPWTKLTTQGQLTVARAIGIAGARLGMPSVGIHQRLVREVESRYPADSSEVNQLLCELLVATESRQVVAKTLPLIVQAKTQEEKFHYLVSLRQAKGMWTTSQRKTYIDFVRSAREFYGAQYLPKYIQWLKNDIASSLTDAERPVFEKGLGEEPTEPLLPQPQITRPHVRNWQLDDLEGSIQVANQPRDLRRGEEVFKAALCIRCHRMGTTGSSVGPDLTQVSRRFGRRDLLLSILAPSQVIDEKYRATTIVTTAGQVVTGQAVGDPTEKLTVMTDLLSPNSMVTFAAAEIESLQPSLVSTMPSGLLNTFSKEEILDLLAFIESGTVTPAAGN